MPSDRQQGYWSWAANALQQFRGVPVPCWVQLSVRERRDVPCIVLATPHTQLGRVDAHPNKTQVPPLRSGAFCGCLAEHHRSQYAFAQSQSNSWGQE